MRCIGLRKVGHFNLQSTPEIVRRGFHIKISHVVDIVGKHIQPGFINDRFILRLHQCACRNNTQNDHSQTHNYSPFKTNPNIHKA